MSIQGRILFKDGKKEVDLRRTNAFGIFQVDTETNSNHPLATYSYYKNGRLLYQTEIFSGETEQNNLFFIYLFMVVVGIYALIKWANNWRKRKYINAQIKNTLL